MTHLPARAAEALAGRCGVWALGQEGNLQLFWAAHTSPASLECVSLAEESWALCESRAFPVVSNANGGMSVFASSSSLRTCMDLGPVYPSGRRNPGDWDPHIAGTRRVAPTQRQTRAGEASLSRGGGGLPQTAGAKNGKPRHETGLEQTGPPAAPRALRDTQPTIRAHSRGGREERTCSGESAASHV